MQNLKVWDNPSKDVVGDTPVDFLRMLGGAAVIYIDGRDSSRTRVLVTLTHGNEPSGLRAVHRWLAAGDRQPAVNIVVILGAVATALTQPLFFYRHLPGRRDLNRCFRAPYDEDDEGRLALAMLDEIRKHRPEAVVDMHNTSGSSNPFAIVSGDSEKKRRLAGWFVDCLINSDLRLGALMERDAELDVPIVTVEAGGVQDSKTADNAWLGVSNYFSQVDLYQSAPQVYVLHNPLRLELCHDASIDYSDRCLPDTQVVVRKDIEAFNFVPVRCEDMLGWLNGGGLGNLKVIKGEQTCDAEVFFRLEEGKFYPRNKMQVFMATTQRNIAVSDCLFYFI
ncbi:MAG: succinylglutamate desuccinylase/aspartoacylase family protein [Pseudomonadota bacterium]|nr:succinylglutamate desuccinylase/aspartoacylase family protein [Pseudomonadota bacterium]